MHKSLLDELFFSSFFHPTELQQYNKNVTGNPNHINIIKFIIIELKVKNKFKVAPHCSALVIKVSIVLNAFSLLSMTDVLLMAVVVELNH